MDDRLQELEIKLAFVERHVLELDQLVRDLHEQLERVNKELVSLREMAMPEEKSSPEAERPPHYDRR